MVDFVVSENLKLRKTVPIEFKILNTLNNFHTQENRCEKISLKPFSLTVLERAL